MFSEPLRRRLEELNRQPLPAPLRIFRGPEAAPLAESRLRAAPSGMPLVGLVRQGVLQENSVGSHLRIVLPLERLWPGGPALVQKRHEFLLRQAASLATPVESPGGKSPAGVADFRMFVGAFPRQTILLDLETCGFAGSAVFLVGLLRQIDGQLAIELLLARDYSEEAAVLVSLWERLISESLLVTFNGKSFDWTMVVDRSRRHRLERDRLRTPPRHIDLLHAARRRWRGQLPDCRLKTLEERVCGRRRADDIPGSQIPAAYAQFVRTGFEREMDAILYHNAMDLVTLLDLAMRLA